MSYYTQKLDRWLLPMVAVGVMLSVLLPARSPALAGMAGTLVTTDYFVSHPAFPDSKAPIHTEVALTNVERAIEFISTLRGVKQVALLGWSLAASREAPLYTLSCLRVGG